MTKAEAADEVLDRVADIARPIEDHDVIGILNDPGRRRS